MNLGNLKSFPVLRLPTELRLQIYEPLIAMGHLSILRASKKVHKEAASLLQKNAIMRVNLGRNSVSPIVSLQSLPIIPEVEFRFGIGTRYYPYGFLGPNNHIIELFGGRDVARARCTITMDFSPARFFHDLEHFSRLEVWRLVADLCGFETLIVEMGRVARDSGERYVWQNEEEGEYIRELYIEDSRKLCAVLEPGLGPAVVEARRERCVLSFSPRRWNARVSVEVD